MRRAGRLASGPVDKGEPGVREWGVGAEEPAMRSGTSSLREMKPDPMPADCARREAARAARGAAPTGGLRARF